MRVLVTGADGFLGRAIVQALRMAGHEVVEALRRRDRAADPATAIAIDLAADTTTAIWQPRLTGINAVVNVAGVFRETGGQTFEAIHVRSPVALFEAGAAVGLRRIVQISALGADAGASSAFHLSKRRADEKLLALPVSAVVVQPSLVFGRDGASAQWLVQLASLPWIPLPGCGAQVIQPIHIDDLAAAVVHVLVHPDPPRRLAAVGPACLSLRDYLAALRGGLGHRRARFANVPMPLVQIAAWLGDFLGLRFGRDALAMLERGNCADAAPITALLGRPPRAPQTFVGADAPSLRRATARRIGFGLLRLAVAMVWFVSGLVSLGAFPLDESYALLARAGVPTNLASLALYSAATLDLALGLAVLAGRAYGLQMLLIAFYTLVISLRLPEFWLHPYAPIAKNLPLLAALWLLRAEKR